MNRRTFLGTALLVSAVLLLGKSAEALTIVPPSLEYAVKPGETINAKIKLFNEESNAITVFSSVANFTAKGERGEPDFQFEDTPTGAASWVEPPAGAITVKPNDRIELPVTITVPANAEPGGHYVSVFFGTDPTLKAENGGQVTVRSLLGTLVILRVDGTIRESATVAGFTAGNGKTLTKLPATFTLRIKNTGNVHVRPQGEVVIKNLFGGEPARLSLNETNGAALPDSVRAYDVIWKKAAEKQTTGNFFEELGHQWRNFALGPYTATASITYGSNKQNLVATTKINVIPWQLLLVSGLIIVIVILAIVFGIRAYNQAIINRARGTTPPPTTGMKL